ncbi:MAG: sugar phosphate isomerase/epimerase [Clostridia bacterium]|nr:sugar phosphate isomerase/epimerase [Clostridia bacterium]
MKISTEIGMAANFIGEKKAVEEVAKAGFDAWDFSMTDNMALYDWSTGKLRPNDHPLATDNYLKFARELKKIGEDNGIHCNQSHAPFPCIVPEVRAYLKRSIECTAEAGGNICVIHPCNDWTLKQNAEMYFELLPFAKSCGVKIATENMWNWDGAKDQASPAACSDEKSFCAMLDEVKDEYFVACLDIGHAEMRGLNTDAVKMIHALGDKLQALHIHDNDKHYDSHELPYTMNIDFPPIIKALKDVNYGGYFTLETVCYIKNKDEVTQKLLKMKEVARKMADEFEND